MKDYLMDLLGTSAALMAAQQTSLLLALLDGPATAAEYARRLSLNARATERVLDVLVVVGIAGKIDNRYVASEHLRKAAAEMPGGLGLGLALWGRTPAFLRTGEPFMRVDANPTEREATYRDIVGSLSRMFSPPAQELANRIEEAPASILDVGCGAGVWSLAIAERFRTTHVTGLDLPGVVATFEARAREMGMQSRVSTIGGDIHTVEIPERTFDLVMIANLLRIDTPERGAHIVDRAALALAPGGRLIVVDAFAGGTPERDRARAVYALHLAMRSRNGNVHTVPEIRRWAEAAGLRYVDDFPLDDVTSVGALILARPEQ